MVYAMRGLLTALRACLGFSFFVFMNSQASAQFPGLTPVAGAATPLGATQLSMQGLFTDVQNTGTLLRSGSGQLAGGSQSLMGSGLGLFGHKSLPGSGIRSGVGQLMVGSGQLMGAGGQVAAMPFKFLALGPQMLLALPGQGLVTAGQTFQGANLPGMGTAETVTLGHRGLFQRNIVARGPKYIVTEPRQSLLSRFHRHK